MDPENSPAATTANAPPPDAAASFEVEEVSKTKRKWTLSIYPGHVGLCPAGEPQPFVFFREDFFVKLELMPGMRLLALRVDPKVGLKLPKDAVAGLRRWFGVPNREQLAVLLKRRYSFSIPVALLFLMVSFPVRMSDLAPERSFNWFNLAMGLTLLAFWGWSRWRPHPVLFLLDSAWFMALAISHFLTLCRTHHWGWLVWTFLLCWFAMSGVRRYEDFRRPRS